MKTRRLLCVFIVMLSVAPGVTAQANDFNTVSEDMLRDPPPGDWLNWRRTDDAWGYSPLDQITRENVATLIPVWSLSTGVTSGHQSPPIVNNGIMFVTTPEDQVLAIRRRSN